MNRTLPLILFLLLLVPMSARATQEFTGRITRIVAGDLVRIRIDRAFNSKMPAATVHLHRIVITKEREARSLLEKIALGKRAVVLSLSPTVKGISADDVSVGRRDLGKELVRRGFARRKPIRMS
jgi:hypothetical protein